MRYVVVWKIAGREWRMPFSNFVDADEYMFTRVPKAKECEYRYIDEC